MINSIDREKYNFIPIYYVDWIFPKNNFEKLEVLLVNKYLIKTI